MQRLIVGDQVVITRGNDKGKRGKVTRVLRERGAVVVEGVNRVKRHLKPTPQRGGGILEIEAPIAASNVALIDPVSGKPTRIRFGKKDDKKIRIAKGGGEIAEPTR